MEAIRCVRDFNDENDLLDKKIEKAKDSCQDLLSWLYLAMKNKAFSVLMIACSDITIQKYFQELERAHLSKTQFEIMDPATNSSSSNQDITRPLEVIANSSNITRDYLDRLTSFKQAMAISNQNPSGKLQRSINE